MGLVRSIGPQANLPVESSLAHWRIEGTDDRWILARTLQEDITGQPQAIGLCCKNFLRTELLYQLALVIQQLRKFSTRILLDLKCHLFRCLEFVLFGAYSLLRNPLVFALLC